MTRRNGTTIVAVCGKGGVGKTALCALLGRALLDCGRGPLLMIDADPVSGLVSALGLPKPKTLASVRSELIGSARGSDDATRQRIADQLDYLVMEALVEREDFSLLAMGNTSDKGCFCAVNALLRDAIDIVVDPFDCVVIDGEAGIEQVNRQVTRRVDRVIVVTDGSRRSVETLSLIAGRTSPEKLAVVASRGPEPAAADLPDGVRVLGAIPDDPFVRDFDREGRSLWELPRESEAMAACRRIARDLLPRGGE